MDSRSSEAAELREQLQKVTDALEAMQLTIEKMGHQLGSLEYICRGVEDPRGLAQRQAGDLVE